MKSFMFRFNILIQIYYNNVKCNVSSYVLLLWWWWFIIIFLNINTI